MQFRLPTLIATLLASASTLAAQSVPRRIGLDDAIRLAQQQSQAVGIAAAAVTRDQGQRIQTASQNLPQVGGTLGYTRTLASQFSGLSSSAAAPDTSASAVSSLCAPRISSSATPAERTAALNAATTCQQSSGGINFSSVGFGAANEWALGLNASQNVYTAGRINDQIAAARAQERSAGIEVTAQKAQSALDAAQAYYDAILADRLVSISDSGLAETEDVLRLTKVGHDVGEQSDFDLLKAQVTRDNQKPVVIQARANRQVAYLRLKQLIGMPLDDSLQLATVLDDTTPPPAMAGATVDTSVSNRSAVREVTEAVNAQQQLLKAARAEYKPSVAITTGYQRLYFPSSIFPQLNHGANNWTIGISSNLSIFNGYRTHGDELVAQANLEQARQQLSQTQQLAALDARVALNELDQALAAWQAVVGTVDQAQKAYGIDEIRFREGLSTQTDLAQSRLLLQQATANRAQAARDLAVARIRVTLLRDLPIQLTSGSSAASASRSTTQQTSTSASPTTQTAPTTTGTSTGGTGGTGGGLDR